MQFLKLGKYTINPSAIAFINWEHCQKKMNGESVDYYRVYFQASENNEPYWLSFRASSLEGRALKKYFDNTAIDLMADAEFQQDIDWLESRAALEMQP